MITFKQEGEKLTPYWQQTGEPITEKDWKKIAAGVKRSFGGKSIIARPAIEVSQMDRDLTDTLYILIKQNFDFLVPKPTPEKEYLEMNKLHRIDGRDYRTIALIIKWSQQDPFWKQNIRSVTKLRKQFDTLLIRAQSDIKERSNKVVAV